MNHSRSIRKFLQNLICNNGFDKEPSPPLDSFTMGRIPEELFTEEWKQTNQPSSLCIAGQAYKNFDLVFDELRKDLRTEYLTDKELKDRLWLLVCDVYVNKEIYRKNTAKLKLRIEEFMSDIQQPLQEYDVFFRILHFDTEEILSSNLGLGLA